MYCKKCGGKVESYASNCPFCGEPIVSNSVEATYTASNDGRPATRSVGQWILTFILMAITPINLIMLFVWAFGHKTDNDRTFKNWAKAELIIMLISIILSVLLIVVMLPTLVELISEFEGAIIY